MRGTLPHGRALLQPAPAAQERPERQAACARHPPADAADAGGAESHQVGAPDHPGMADERGRTERAVDVATGTALWSAHGKTMPVRWVLSRDPTGRAETRVFVCSDPEQSALQILTWYAMRWAVEPTFQEARRHLGFETQRQWSDRAIHRTTPLLLGLFSMVTLWAADMAARTGQLVVLGAAWYRKPDPTFADCLAVVRRMLWAEEAVSPILWRDDCPTWRARARTAENPRPLQQRLAKLMSYAA